MSLPMKNFWQNLPRPFLVQAPMESVTDTVFRQTLAKAGKPDVFFTEFTNTDGLQSKGQEEVGKRLKFTQIERPLIAQLWGNDPKKYQESAKMIIDMGFDGIDINMGCPIIKGSCASLIKNPQLAKEIIRTTQEAAGDLPVSVKTRLGFSKLQTEEWIGFLLELDLDALTVHGRTKAEMSKVDAHWDEIGKVVKLRDAMKKKTVIIGNGDVLSYQDALEKYKTYGVDGIMIGRGIFHNLWVFNKDRDPATIPVKEKLEMMIEHVTLFDKTWGQKKPLEMLKKFYKVYVSGMDNASEIRMQLMACKTKDETVTMINDLIQKLP